MGLSLTSPGSYIRSFLSLCLPNFFKRVLFIIQFLLPCPTHHRRMALPMRILVIKARFFISGLLPDLISRRKHNRKTQMIRFFCQVHRSLRHISLLLKLSCSLSWALSVPRYHPNLVARIWRQSLYRCIGRPGRKIHWGSRGDSLCNSNSFIHQKIWNGNPSIVHPSRTHACTKSRSFFNCTRMCNSSMTLRTGISRRPQDLITASLILSIDGLECMSFITRENRNSYAAFDISSIVNIKPSSPLISTG